MSHQAVRGRAPLIRRPGNAWARRTERLGAPYGRTGASYCHYLVTPPPPPLPIPYPAPTLRSTRAVDLVCRPQLAAFQKCRDGAGAGHATACVRERTAFDVCTEDF